MSLPKAKSRQMPASPCPCQRCLCPQAARQWECQVFPCPVARLRDISDSNFLVFSGVKCQPDLGVQQTMGEPPPLPLPEAVSFAALLLGDPMDPSPRCFLCTSPAPWRPGTPTQLSLGPRLVSGWFPDSTPPGKISALSTSRLCLKALQPDLSWLKEKSLTLCV